MTWIVPAASFQADNQGTPQEKVVLEIHPFALKNKRAKACFLKIPLHAAGKDALRLLGIQGLLNDARVGLRGKQETLVLIPVLHHHGNGGCPAGVSLLLNKWNVQPDSRRASRRAPAGAAERV